MSHHDCSAQLKKHGGDTPCCGCEKHECVQIPVRRSVNALTGEVLWDADEKWSDAEWIEKWLYSKVQAESKSTWAEVIAAAFSRQRKELDEANMLLKEICTTGKCRDAKEARKELEEDVLAAMQKVEGAIYPKEPFGIGFDNCRNLMLSAVRDVFNKLNGV